MAAFLALSASVSAQQAPPAKASSPPPPSQVLPSFDDITRAAGINFTHRSAPEKKYILESMSGGVALVDVDNDDLLDIYFVNALTVATSDAPETAPSALYRNLGPGDDGTLRFQDIASTAGVALPGWGMGVCAADVDGDGWRDLYVTAYGPNRLYRHQGIGKNGMPSFEEIAAAAGVEAGGWSAGCGFADYDRDGDLDLFVSRYVHIALDELPELGKDKTCQFRGIAVQCGPRGLPGVSDLLFRNDSPRRDDGTLTEIRFTDVSKSSGVTDPDGYFGLGVAWFDADGDGWLDLFVANDATPNFFYHNKGDGTFEESAFFLGVAVSEDGAEQGAMGVALGDYQNDGRLDLFVTNFAEEYNSLYDNDGDYFTDVSFRSTTAPASLPYVGWGTAFLDVENDGWLDLVLVNGHVYPQLDNARLGASAPYRQRRLFYRNLGPQGESGRIAFEEIGEKLGEVFTELRVSRGLALGDLDNDGRQDVVINDLDGSPQVLINTTPEVGNWLMVELNGKVPNTDAIGALVTVRAGELQMTRLVQSGTSYISQHDFRRHFGLGEAKHADIEVRWPNGKTIKREKVAAGQVLVIEE